MATNIILQHGDLIEFDYEKKRVRGVIMGFEINDREETGIWVFTNRYDFVGKISDGKVSVTEMNNVKEEELICIALETLKLWNYKRIGIGFSPREMTNFMISSEDNR